MTRSDAVAEALVTFFAGNASGDAATFEEVVSTDEDALAIGSTAREWFHGQGDVRAAYGLEGVGIDPGEILAWENGETGWAVARPLFSIPDGPSFRLRFTAVFVQERGGWRLVHLHASYPVPDEVAVENPHWWENA
jgi:ketosteroid isomerase-like protein